MLEKHLLEQFPGDGFLGEEFGETLSTTGFRWIVDPIDGTRSFVRGVPHWATLAAIEYDGEPIAGVAYEPVIDRMWRAMRGDGAYRDDRRIHVSTIDSLAESQMFYSSMSWFVKADKQDRVHPAGASRRSGSAALATITATCCSLRAPASS